MQVSVYVSPTTGGPRAHVSTYTGGQGTTAKVPVAVPNKSTAEEITALLLEVIGPLLFQAAEEVAKHLL
jgi:hypothetical protein